MTPETNLTPTQEKVALALAAGSTITGAAAQAGINRVTVYRWMQTIPEFELAVERNRAEFTLARRDDLHYLSSRAMDALLSILDNPRSSPAVLLKAAMFILQREQKPAKNWSLPERMPEPATLNETLVTEVLTDDATECDTVSQENPGVTPQTHETEEPYRTGQLSSCPVPPEVLMHRKIHQNFLRVVDAMKTAPNVENSGKDENQDLAA